MVLRLVVAVLHYMFRPTWPSSSVYDILFYIAEGICFCCLFLHVVTLCTFSSVGWVKYEVLLFIITYATFLFCYSIHVFTCALLLFSVNFLILVCLPACRFLMSVGFVLLSVVYFV
jgi:hypothetical protein